MSGGSTMRIGRGRRLRSGGRGPDGLDWALRVGVVVVCLSACWTGWSMLRPLPTPDAPTPVVMPDVPVHADDVEDEAARALALTELVRDNLFDDERRMWSAPAATVTGAPVEPKGPAGGEVADPSGSPAGGDRATVSIDGRTVELTKAESVPDDVKQALTGLALRGIYRVGGGEALAMISRVHAGPNPLMSDVWREGDVFEDKQHPQAKWRLVAIDAAGSRVILERSGTTLALEMFTSRPMVAASAAPAARVERRVIERTREEVAADLLAAGIPEEEVSRLIKLAELSEEQAEVQRKLNALTAKPASVESSVEATSDGEKAKPARRGPPPGLELIAKMLQSAPTEGSAGLPIAPTGDAASEPKPEERRKEN